VKIEEAREAYYTASGTVSDICRQACFAGIAVVWIFQDSTKTPQRIEEDLLWPLSFLVLSLILDLAHYVSKTAIWGFYSRWREHLVNAGEARDNDRKVPAWFNGLPLTFFWVKAGACITGYVLILSLIYCRLI
jgi:hypothetical protein